MLDALSIASNYRHYKVDSSRLELTKSDRKLLDVTAFDSVKHISLFHHCVKKAVGKKGFSRPLATP